jgi:Protein of unknown function (DUF1003)
VGVTNGAVQYISSTITNIGDGKQFDPEPWILLNLIFSAVAFYTGALVIIAQKAQTRTDKAKRGGGREASRRAGPDPDRAAAAEHRSHRTDPNSRPATSCPDRASPRSDLRAPAIDVIAKAMSAASARRAAITYSSQESKDPQQTEGEEQKRPVLLSVGGQRRRCPSTTEPATVPMPMPGTAGMRSLR